MKEEKKQMLIRVIGTIIVLVLIIGGIYFLVRKDSQNRNSTSSSPSNIHSAILSVRDNDWIKGKKDAKVVIIEYADYQCPACAYVSLTSLNEVAKTYPNDVAIIYRNFPLDYHQFSFETAVACEVAGEAGKFWEIHDALFANQDKISHEEILNIAQSLGFNRTEFENKMNDKKYKDKVYKDQMDAEDLKLNQTPTLFINGVEYTGNFDSASIIAEVKKHL